MKINSRSVALHTTLGISSLAFSLLMFACGGSDQPSSTKPKASSMDKSKKPSSVSSNITQQKVDTCPTGQVAYQFPTKDDACLLDYRALPAGKYVLTEVKTEITEPDQKLKLYSIRGFKISTETVDLYQWRIPPAKSLLDKDGPSSEQQLKIEETSSYVYKNFGTLKSKSTGLNFENNIGVNLVINDKGEIAENDVRKYFVNFENSSNTNDDKGAFGEIREGTFGLFKTFESVKSASKGIYEFEGSDANRKATYRIAAVKTSKPNSFGIYYQYNLEKGDYFEKGSMNVLSHFHYEMQK